MIFFLFITMVAVPLGTHYESNISMSKTIARKAVDVFACSKGHSLRTSKQTNVYIALHTIINIILYLYNTHIAQNLGLNRSHRIYVHV